MKSIKECLHDSIINEMAVNLSKFRANVQNLGGQILENWCLVKLSDEYPDMSFANNRHHWATELKSHMSNIVSQSLKSGRKDKTIKMLWIDELEYNDHNVIADKIRSKFNKEGLQKYVNKISYECAEAADEIVKVLSSSEIDVESYIQGELG